MEEGQCCRSMPNRTNTTMPIVADGLGLVDGRILRRIVCIRWRTADQVA
jgi:hypothetical protein